MSQRASLIITEQLSGRTVGEVLPKFFSLSKRAITRLKQHPLGILVNNAHVTVRYVLKKGDCLSVLLKPEETPSNIIPKKMALAIVYEDDDFLAVNKPPDMPMYPNFHYAQQNLASGVLYYFGTLGISQVFRPISRLDKDTSGIVLLAKNAYIQHQFTSVYTKKTYLALAEGIIASAGQIELPIRRETEGTMRRIVADDGKYAKTVYMPLSIIEGNTLLQVELLTGRTHQIRVHLCYSGHPLLGDKLYDGDTSLWKRQALHAWRLEFVHPLTKKMIRLLSPFEELRRYYGK